MNELNLLTQDQIEAIIRDVVDMFLIPKFRELNMNATGEWINSLEVKGSSIYGRKYTEQLEYGRRPGKFAPIEPLIKWAQAKLGLDYENARNAAFAINHKIKNEGTSWHQKGGSDLMDVLKSQECIDFINRTAQPFIVNQLTLNLSQTIRESFK